MAPKGKVTKTFEQLVPAEQVRVIQNLVQSGKLKVADLNLPKYAKYKDALQGYYGTTMQLIASDDTGSLMGLFSDAISKGMTDSGFQNALKQTNWYLKYDASNRMYQTKLNDPAAQQDLATKREEIKTAVQNQAVADTGKKLDDATVASISENLLQNYYETWQTKVQQSVRTALSGMDVSQFGGTILNTSTTLKDYARKMGIALSDKSILSYTSNVLAGNTTVDAVQGEFRKMALPYYSQFADRINAGDTVADITSPYRNMIASMLEVDPESIGFEINGPKMDPLLLKAMSGGDGGKAVGLYDLRKMIKQDSRWQYTRNAQEEYASLTTKLMRMFGAGV